MTRANIYLTLPESGKQIVFVCDSSAYPEHICPYLFIPILAIDTDAEILELIKAEGFDTETRRTNATYRYYIDCKRKFVTMFDENYNYKTNRFNRGKNLSYRMEQESPEWNNYIKEHSFAE